MKDDNKYVQIYELGVLDDKYEFLSAAKTALSAAESELNELDEKLNENLESIRKITPDCDKLDYALAASSGAICGLFDIFLVGKPGESPLGNITDKWFEDRTKDFAKYIYKSDIDGKDYSYIIRKLEKDFEIPYDQTGIGQAAKKVFGLKPINHHFKSLGHNPSILGLFFSVLDQFTNGSHFVSDGEIIPIHDVGGNFVLRGNSVLEKLFRAFKNWFGHLISDTTGSANSKGRGMGIPSPLWTWTNDIIAIKNQMNIPVTEFDKALNDIALEIYKKGFDLRFQAVQTIPVLLNELITRFFYSVRRLIRFFLENSKENRTFERLWKSCEPFSNASVKRMLTVAHGTFCLIDLGDAAVRGAVSGAGTFNFAEFFMRLNIAGIGRFGISLYGEISRGFEIGRLCEDSRYLERKKIIVEDYIRGLKILSEKYDDKDLLTFTDELKNSELYKSAFLKSVKLAELRGVPQDKILKNKSDIDNYFMGGNKI